MDARAALLNFEKFFGCKIEFGAKTDQITFDKRAAELGLVGDESVPQRDPRKSGTRLIDQNFAMARSSAAA
jgi:hypothetical protein